MEKMEINPVQILFIVCTSSVGNLSYEMDLDTREILIFMGGKVWEMMERLKSLKRD